MLIKTIHDISLKKSFSEKEILEDINSCFKMLTEIYHLESGSCLIYKGGNSYHFFICLLAAIKLNLHFIPLASDTTDAEIERITIENQPQLIVMQEHFLTQNYPPLGISGLSLFSSGSTGLPKQFTFDWKKVESKISKLSTKIDMSELAISLCILPTSFGHGLIGNSLLPLLSGCELVIGKPFDITTLKKLSNIITDKNVTFISSVPTIWSLCERLSIDLNQKTLRRIHTASAPFSEKNFQYIKSQIPGARLFNIFGMTECLSWLSGKELIDFDSGNVGSMWDGTAKITDNKLAISCSHIYDYLNLNKNDSLTMSDENSNFFDTNDLATLNLSNEIMLLGRSSFQINRAGLKISPEEVETAINRNSYIEESAVLAIDHSDFNQLVLAVIVPRNHPVQDQNELINRLMSDLTKYLTKSKLPDRVHVMSQLPRNSRGKIDYQKIKEIYYETKD